jgi:peptidylprolyl isomerase
MKVLAGIAMVLALIIIGCGDGSDESTTSTESAAPAQDTTVLESPPDPEREAKTQAWIRAASATDGAADARWSGLEKAAGPLADQLLIPHGPPPAEVVVRELKEGDGPTLEPGDSFGVKYSAYEYDTGKQNQSYSTGPIPLYHYGTRETVKAWDPGLKEMKVGEVRELIVPSAWAYKEGPLVYLIELLVVR